MAFTAVQTKKIADILADIAQVAFASIALPFFLDQYKPAIALSGAGIALLFWIASVYLVNKADI